MLTWLRRFLILMTLLFWLGGFAFYGGVVVPYGRAAFREDFAKVTAPVTTVLNVAGIPVLALLAWDGFAGRDRLGWRRRGRWLTWVMAAFSVTVLFGLHFWLDRMMTMAEQPVTVADPVFYPVHRAYLWIGAAGWLAAVVNSGLMLASWRDEDRQPLPAPPAAPPGPEAPPPGTA